MRQNSGRASSHQRGTPSKSVRYTSKRVWGPPRLRAAKATLWESKGWEVETRDEGRFWESVRLSRPVPERRRGLLTLASLLVVVVVAALVITSGVLARDYFSEVRSDARAAVKALKSGDLSAQGHLAVYRGNPDFAYFFTSSVTPRDIGDALATVAGPSEGEPFRAGLDTHAYALTLTDLAGTLALATHDREDRALPESWTTDFITATTTPVELYGKGGWFDKAGKLRERRDMANKANLLLVLSRGYWSTEFLQSVTRGYYEFDLREGKDAWPTPRPRKDVKFAPAPNGVYLTDGILSLTAALTANPAAAEWAFTDFQPGTESIDESDYVIGKFTHYLLFEHRFPETPDGESVGVTSALTALSAAIDSSAWASGPVDARAAQVALGAVGPLHDAAVLQALALEITEEGGCSWDPRTYWNCTKDVAEDVWEWIRRWGHVALDVLVFAATSASPLFKAIGVGASATNSAWHAIQGDYVAAGLSLASARPDLAFRKVSTSVQAGVAAQRAAADAAHVARITKQIQSGADPAMNRVVLKYQTRAMIEAQAPKDELGFYIDPNTRRPIVGKPDIGHKPGYEWRCIQAKARFEGWSRQQLIDFANNPNHYQLEDPSSNRGRAFEASSCAP